jgi:hypothetical protein
MPEKTVKRRLRPLERIDQLSDGREELLTQPRVPAGPAELARGHLGKLCTGGCAERLAESGHENRVQRMEVEMTDPAMSATETACCPRFPHSAHLAPAGSSCLRT